MRAASAAVLNEIDEGAREPHVVGAVSDEALMDRFRQGSSSAFEELFERYRDQVFFYLARLTGRVASEDLTQTTFLSVIHGCNQFLAEARFKPWLYTIATNVFRDYQRRNRLEDRNRIVFALDSSDRGYAPTYQDAGLKRAVWFALQQLPESQRLPVVMHRFQELSFSEIGEVLRLEEQVVRARAYRGYERLRELLQSIWVES